MSVSEINAQLPPSSLHLLSTILAERPNSRFFFLSLLFDADGRDTERKCRERDEGMYRCLNHEVPELRSGTLQYV